MAAHLNAPLALEGIRLSALLLTILLLFILLLLHLLGIQHELGEDLDTERLSPGQSLLHRDALCLSVSRLDASIIDLKRRR